MAWFCLTVVPHISTVLREARCSTRKQSESITDQKQSESITDQSSTAVVEMRKQINISGWYYKHIVVVQLVTKSEPNFSKTDSNFVMKLHPSH